MKKIAVLVGGAVIGALVVLAVTPALESEPSAAPTTTSTTTSTVPLTTTTSTLPPTTTTTTLGALPPHLVDEAFVYTMREQSAQLDLVTWVDVATDDQIVEWGLLFCDILDSGVSWFDAIEGIIEIGKDSFDAGWNVDDESMVAFGSGAAIFGYCPEHQDKVGRR